MYEMNWKQMALLQQGRKKGRKMIRILEGGGDEL
jgi:hypothetical protein